MRVAGPAVRNGEACVNAADRLGYRAAIALSCHGLKRTNRCAEAAAPRALDRRERERSACGRRTPSLTWTPPIRPLPFLHVSLAQRGHQSHAPAEPVSMSACLSLSQLMNIRVYCVWKRIHPFQAIPPVFQRSQCLEGMHHWLCDTVYEILLVHFRAEISPRERDALLRMPGCPPHISLRSPTHTPDMEA
ncbi:hypothetical protein DPX16_6576 [Anabarilius grahami]|uniref:Uncharacterized protein n=1 Tax=Anabarilius grahami TaxID=495550 RepID=A0A3N0XY02_ANAGA|nr:hypothetical protein DPX16_6576 [Anabarilius grahami]